MVFYLTENKAKKLFKKYNRTVVFAVDRAMKACTIGEDGDKASTVYYKYLEEMYPSTDEINGYIRGDISAKKVIKNFRKKMNTLKPVPEAIDLQVTIATLMNMLSSNEGTVIVFLRPEHTDNDSRKLDKLFKKYLSFLFEGFGLELQTNIPKKLLKGKRKEIARRIIRAASSKSALSKVGRHRLNLLFALHYADIQKASLDHVEDLDEDLTKKQFTNAVARFYKMLNGDFVQDFQKHMLRGECSKKEKKSRKNQVKCIEKQAKRNIEYYNEYCEMVNGLSVDGIPELPKFPKYGKKLKGKKQKKLVKKFDKAFGKRKGFGLLRGAYAHIVTQTYGIQIGTSEYNDAMEDSHKHVPVEDFSKAYSTLATKIRKAEAAAKKEAEKAKANA